MKVKLLYLHSWVIVAATLGLATQTVRSGPASDSPVSVPATNQVLNLDEALRLAFASHPELRAAQARLDAAAGRQAQAGLWSNPELELSAEEWPVDGSGFSRATRLVGVSQTVPFPGKKPLDRQIGGQQVRVSEAELSLRRLELVRDVKVAFCQALAADRLAAVATELVRVAGRSAETARKRVAAGAAPDQEQLRAEIQLEQANNELAGFRGGQAHSRQSLAASLGQPGLTAVTLAGQLEEQPSLALLDQDAESWLAAHPALVAARENQKRAGLELRRARLEPYPDVKFGLAGGRLGESSEGIVELRLSLPLPIIDRSRGRQREARANATLAEAEAAAVEQRWRQAWEAARRRARIAAEQAANCRERILPKADAALRLVQNGFEQGKFGFMDLLDTQRTASETRLVYLQKVLDLNVALAELKALSGSPLAAASSGVVPPPPSR
jgi:cobalt-zinc-cadmium efflux system outer membrane protein